MRQNFEQIRSLPEIYHKNQRPSSIRQGKDVSYEVLQQKMFYEKAL